MIHWYPITAMKVAHVPVWVSGPGFEVMAEIRRHAKLSKPGNPVWWWMEILKTGKTRELAAVGIADGDARRGLRTAPVLFRPLDPSNWPHGLPAPVSVPLPAIAKPSSLPPEPEDGTIQGDDFPYRMWLGSQVPPETLKECEARLLRALRTERSPAVSGIGNHASNFSADIPRQMAQIALSISNWERRTEERLANPGKTDWETHEAASSGWTPNRRDISDWDYCLDWLVALDFQEFLAIAMRSADPQWNYRLIGEDDRMKMAPDQVRWVYKRAIAKAFRRARR